jgi:hypothetical protein
VERAISQIEAQGVELAIVGTGGDPATARALYEKLGFNPLHLVRCHRPL